MSIISDDRVADALEHAQHGLRLLARQSGERDAEDEREEDQPEEIPARHGLDRVLRHDVDEGPDAEPVGRGGADAGGGLAGIGLEQPRADARIERGAGLEDVHGGEAEHDGEAGREHEEADGLAADAADAAQVAEVRHAQGEGREDQRHDDHEEHPQEDLPDRLCHVIDGPEQAGRVSPEDVGGHAGGRAADQAEEDLRVQRNAPLAGLGLHRITPRQGAARAEPDRGSTNVG